MNNKRILILICSFCMILCQISPIAAAVDNDYDMNAKLHQANTALSFISAAFWKIHVDLKVIAIQMDVSYKVKGSEEWKRMTGYCVLTPLMPSAPILLHHPNIRSNPTPHWDLYVIKSYAAMSSSQRAIRSNFDTKDAKEEFKCLAQEYPDNIEHYSGEVNIAD